MVEAKQKDRVLWPKTFSATKMANHSAAVYHKFREMVPALLKTMWQVKLGCGEKRRGCQEGGEVDLCAEQGPQCHIPPQPLSHGGHLHHLLQHSQQLPGGAMSFLFEIIFIK